MNKLKRVTVFLTVLLILLVGCTTNSSLKSYANHSDELYTGCTNQFDGSRLGYHFTNRTWISDCDNPLKRDYWRVFENQDGVYSIIPRPDWFLSFFHPCENLEPKILALASKYELCGEPFKINQVNRINSMPIRDALLLTHYLHSKLKFKVSKAKISPFPRHADILAACQIRPHSMEFENECTRFVKAYGCGKLDIEDLNEQFTLGESHFPQLDCVTPFINIINPRIVVKRLNLLYDVL